MSEYQRFLQDKGELMRYDYPLNEDSIVMDVGGYKGEFALNIFNKFHCNIWIYEPVFFKQLEEKFNKFPYNMKMKLFSFGLSNKSGFAKIAVQADSTSLHKVGEMAEIELKDIEHEYYISFPIDAEPTIIDLIKINIEGEEYNLLERMIETGIVNKFVNIQVQFHNFIPDAEKRKNKIQMELLKTHDLVWRYDFIWESWRLK